MTGRMVRMMRFQSLLMENGTTGWMLAVYFIALAGPMPKSQLFWIGTLMRLATGFCEFLRQFGFLRFLVIPRAAARGSCVVGREGERAFEGRIVLGLCRCRCVGASERKEFQFCFHGVVFWNEVVFWKGDFHGLRVASGSFKPMTRLMAAMMSAPESVLRK